MGCIALVRCVLVLRCGSAGVEWYPYASWSRVSACIGRSVDSLNANATYQAQITEDSSVSVVTTVRSCRKTIPFSFEERSLLFLIRPRQTLGLIQPINTDELLSLGGGCGVYRCLLVKVPTDLHLFAFLLTFSGSDAKSTAWGPLEVK